MSHPMDAVASAVVMARHLDEIRALGGPPDRVARREGAIWWPGCPFSLTV